MKNCESSHKLQECIDEFLLYIADIKGMSVNTVIGYRNDLRQFVSMPGFSGDMELSAVKTDMIRGCIGVFSLQKKSAASINRFLTSVKSLFAYCKKFDYIQINPAKGIKGVKIPKRLPRFMTMAELNELCDSPEKKEILWKSRDKALFEMLYSSGCRVSEIAGLEISDLSSDFSSAMVTGKGNKDRQVFFEAEARNALRSYLAERKSRLSDSSEKHVFINQSGTPLTARGIRYILDRYSGAEGTNHHVSPHAFRHTFGTAMVSSGADVRLVQEMLGHASISTTQRYTHINSEKLIELYNKAHPHGGSQ